MALITKQDSCYAATLGNYGLETYWHLLGL